MILFFLFGCVTAKNYPEHFAENACKTMFTCVDNDDIDTFLQYDNEEECVADILKEGESSSVYTDWEAGDKEFNKENAESCLTEISDVQDDADCDGSMNALSFMIDVYSEDCQEVYQ